MRKPTILRPTEANWQDWPAPKSGPAEASVFVETEISCASSTAAKAEALRQQEREPDQAAVEWIYLRNTSGTWVARRTQRYIAPPEAPPTRTSWLGALWEAFLNLPS
jgi:hypothetical protein